MVKSNHFVVDDWGPVEGRECSVEFPTEISEDHGKELEGAGDARRRDLPPTHLTPPNTTDQGRAMCPSSTIHE
jgi:hypothetical protein